MNFGDLSKDSGLKALNDYLLTRSYIEGFKASQSDASAYKIVAKKPADKYVNVLRWYNHINSFGAAALSKLPKGSGPVAATSTDKATEDDDEMDLFGSDDEDQEAKHAEILKKYHEKKAKKPVLIAKSSIVLDIKPFDDETDMSVLEKRVREISTDGLLWGQSKLVPVAFGIKKLQITCVVEDDKVGTDFLEEEIEKIDDMVQSIDIASFQKI
ncbi:Elongation factor 1-beta [Cichlidogyrus casuarinus]|uniref:Elongation factor 1-beta n=1 Tax=Cichlidogyrus casuarinus TaxID=1844966 RepID=A0ABD2PZ32_9PLAT